MENLIDNRQEEEEKMQQMEDEVKKKLVKKNIFSFKFLVLYMITLIRTLTGFYYGGEFKYIGMRLINDDNFITQVAMGAFFLNFMIRFLFGKMHEKFGILCLYYFNIITNFLMSFSLLVLDRSYTGVFLLICFQRIASGIFLIL